MRSLILLSLFVLFGLVSAEATLSATVYLSNGSVANGSNVSVYNLTYGQGVGGGLVVNYTLLNSTTTGASGTFSLGFDNTSASAQYYFLLPTS
ncbi:hypothetical protein HZC08_00110 [Candidatus Micrarchaeota archaeon]|nr:hypothetical protein [Candidatus Micrarchaeota archaeon]